MTLAAFALTVVLGLLLRSGRLGGRSQFEDWADPNPPSTGFLEESEAPNRGLVDRPVPGWMLTTTGLAALGLAAYVAACAYSPSPEEVFRDMAVIKADYYGEIGAAARESPLHHLDLLERQTARLGIGSALRLRSPGAEAQESASALRRDLLRLREATAVHGPEDARRVFQEVQTTYDRCKKAYGVH
ncbi:hypothetical protein [Paludisphaera soli]|uniref:hypothetical protein n=1 Tax=Paludisphaera soli TaxID=2712865 RepID=UPI0013EA5783|nr:hypothetical protein [Paludisphaera soli]